MFCIKCGTILPEGANFCPSCGTAVHTAEVGLSPAAETGRQEGQNDAVNAKDGSPDGQNGAVNAEVGSPEGQNGAVNAKDGSQDGQNGAVNAETGSLGGQDSAVNSSAIKAMTSEDDDAESLGAALAAMAVSIEEKTASDSLAEKAGSETESSKAAAEARTDKEPESSEPGSAEAAAAMMTDKAPESSEFDNSETAAEAATESADPAASASEPIVQSDAKTANALKVGRSAESDAAGSAGPTASAPKEKDNVFDAFAFIGAVVFAIYFFKDFFGGIGNVVSSCGQIFSIGFGSGLLGILAGLLRMASGATALVLALMFAIIYRFWDRNKATELFMGVSGASALLALTGLLRWLLALGQEGAAANLSYIAAAAVCVLVFYGILILMDCKPQIIFTAECLRADLVCAFDAYREIIMTVKDRLDRERSEQDARSASESYTSGSNAYGSNAPGANGPGTNGPSYYSYGTPGPAPARRSGVVLRTNRSLLVFVVLSILTCGIYKLIFIHELTRDVNIFCDGDGEETPGLGKLIILSIITLGIYSWFWLYRLGNRLQFNGYRYGYGIREDGTTVLLWGLLGMFLCGIGPIISWYFLIRNTNMLCAAYNRQ